MSAIASFSQRCLESFNHISLLSLRPLNHRPLEGRQSSPSFIRPRDDHNAEIVLPSVAPFTRDDHNAEIAMKYTTIALAIAVTVPSTLPLARGGYGGGMHIGSSVSRPFSSPVGSGRIANRPRNVTGNTLAPIARDPSG